MERDRAQEKNRGTEAPDLEKRHDRRNPSPAEAGVGAAISGVPSLSSHKKRGQQIEKDEGK